MAGREATTDTSQWIRWIDFGKEAQEMRMDRRARGEEVVATDDHKKLLARVSFQLFPTGGDQVYMGVDGKRPFGNSSNLYDVAGTLDWDVDPEEGLSVQQKIKAVRLMSELPDVLNKLIRELATPVVPES